MTVTVSLGEEMVEEATPEGRQALVDVSDLHLSRDKPSRGPGEEEGTACVRPQGKSDQNAEVLKLQRV